MGGGRTERGPRREEGEEDEVESASELGRQNRCRMFSSLPPPKKNAPHLIATRLINLAKRPGLLRALGGSWECRRTWGSGGKGSTSGIAVFVL